MEASTTHPRTPGADEEPGLDERMTTAARGGGVDAPGEDALLAYFLGNAPAPNAQASEEFTVELGDGREWTCKLAAIEWAEWRDAQEKSINATTGVPDVYVQASYVVARSIRSPKLGRMLQRIRDAAEGDPEALEKTPKDGAAFLREAFRKQSGSLIMLQRHVLRISRLDEEGSGGVKVKEVEAGKL